MGDSTQGYVDTSANSERDGIQKGKSTSGPIDIKPHVGNGCFFMPCATMIPINGQKRDTSMDHTNISEPLQALVPHHHRHLPP